MSNLLVFVLLSHWGIAQSRMFENPLIEDRNLPDPHVVFEGGVYYAVFSLENIPIYTSQDLQNWEFVTFVFNDNNRPTWGLNKLYMQPEIHKVGDEFRVYFSAIASSTRKQAIGVAYASTVLGPYQALNVPLLSSSSDYANAPTILNAKGTLNLIRTSDGRIWAHQLEAGGLTLAAEDDHLLLDIDLEWEGSEVTNSLFVENNGTLFLFYSANNYCGNKKAIGVARSGSPLGPYEKRGDPILVSDDLFVAPDVGAIVVDTDAETNVLIYAAFKAGHVCGSYPRLMCARSTAWGSDGWPYFSN